MNEPLEPSLSEQGDVAVESKTRKAFKVVLHNDEDHTYDYVVELLVTVCSMPKSQAFRCAVEVDLTGRTIVFYGKREDCDNISGKINTWGPDHRLMRSHTSMESSVESF